MGTISIGFGISNGEGISLSLDGSYGIGYGDIVEGVGNPIFYTLYDCANGANPIVGDPATYTCATTSQYTDFCGGTGNILTAAIDEPRIEAEGILLGGDVENLLIKSNNFSDVAWIKANTTITISSETAPNGKEEAYIATTNSGSGGDISQDVGVGVVGTEHSVTLYAKDNGARYLRFYGFGNGREGIVFDLVSGVYQINTSWSSADIKEVGDGWYELTGILTPSASGLTLFSASSGPAGGDFTGDGVSGFHIWQADAIELPFAINPIYTDATPVTQAATDLTYPVPVGFDPAGPWTIEVQFDLLGLDYTHGLIELVGATLSISALPNGLISIAGTGITTFTTSNAVTDGGTLLLTYTEGEINAVLNGITTQSLQALTLADPSSISVGKVSANYMHGHVKQLKISDYDVLGVI